MENVVKSSDSDIIETKEPVVDYKAFNSGEEANDFFYFDDEERGLKAKTRSKQTQWERSLSAEEKDAIVGYAGDGYYDINNYYRRIGDWEHINVDKVIADSLQLDSEISRFELKAPIRVQRGVMEDALDILIEKYGDDGSQWIGKTFYDDGYGSSTAVFGNTVATAKPVVFEISVPAGFGRGVYINRISGFQDVEYESLLKRNSNYIKPDYIEDANIGKCIIRMVMDIE